MGFVIFGIGVVAWAWIIRLELDYAQEYGVRFREPPAFEAMRKFVQAVTKMQRALDGYHIPPGGE